MDKIYQICRTGAIGLGIVLAALAGTASGREAPKEDAIDFNFDRVDVGVFVKLVGQETGRRVVVAGGVEGKISVVSPRVRRSEVYPLFVSILEASGFSVIREGDLHRIVPLPRRVTPAAPVVGIGQPLPREGLLTKIFHLQHVSARDLQSVIESKVAGGKTGGVAAIDETNHLLVTDRASTIRQVEQIIAEIDQAGSARVAEVIPLKFATARDLAQQLTLAMAEIDTRGASLKSRLAVTGADRPGRPHAVIVPSPTANALVLVGVPARVKDIKELIAKMDVDVARRQGRLNALFLKYISAEETAKSINALLLKTPAGRDGGDGRSPIAIEASVANNALLVDASPSDFSVVQRLVEGLDRLPEQVHIEVLIVEITASEGYSLGFDFAAVNSPSEIGDTVVGGSSILGDSAGNVLSALQEGVFPQGITVGLVHGRRRDAAGNLVTDIPGLLSVSAEESGGTIRIRSESSLEAQNNKEASVKSVQEIPILTSTISGGTGTQRDIIQNIERVEVGVKLTLTPHIMPGGQVQMDMNPSIEVIVDDGPEGVAFAPTIAKREVKTTVTVPDGQTIIIAGLTREDQKQVESRVPLLSSIPLLGGLFRKTVETTEKTNILIFVTPRIVRDQVTAERVKTSWESKTGLQSREEEK